MSDDQLSGFRVAPLSPHFVIGEKNEATIRLENHYDYVVKYNVLCNKPSNFIVSNKQHQVFGNKYTFVTLRLVDDLSPEAVEGLLAGNNKFKLMAESEDGSQKRSWLLPVQCDTPESLANGNSSGGQDLRHRRNTSGSFMGQSTSGTRDNYDNVNEARVPSFKISMLVPFLVAMVILWMLEPLATVEADSTIPFLTTRMRFWAAFVVGAVCSWISCRSF